MGLFGYVYLLVPMMKNACRMALASNIQKYTFKMAPGPCKQHFVMFLEDLKLSSRSDIYTTWGMAWAGLSGSEPGADLSAWLAKIMARLSGSTAPSRAVYITSVGRREPRYCKIFKRGGKKEEGMWKGSGSVDNLKTTERWKEGKETLKLCEAKIGQRSYTKFPLSIRKAKFLDGVRKQLKLVPRFFRYDTVKDLKIGW